VIHEFTNLPPLTTDEANAVGAMLIAEGSLDEIASVTNNDLGTFLDLLASPGVQALLAHARRIATHRAQHRLT
jgi:hypothetical protein